MALASHRRERDRERSPVRAWAKTANLLNFCSGKSAYVAHVAANERAFIAQLVERLFSKEKVWSSNLYEGIFFPNGAAMEGDVLQQSS